MNWILELIGIIIIITALMLWLLMMMEFTDKFCMRYDKKYRKMRDKNAEDKKI